MTSHRTFSLDKFIRSVDEKLLRSFFQKHELPLPARFSINPNSVSKVLEGIKNEDNRSDILEDMHCINDIADGSMDLLIQAIKDRKIQYFEDESPETTAMRIYLYKDPEAFAKIHDTFLCSLYSEKLNHYAFEKCKFQETNGNLHKFKKAVEEYFKDKGKSDNCLIRECREGAKYHLFIERGDFMKTYPVFENRGIKHKSLRPGKEDFLLFDKEKSVLSLGLNGYSPEDSRRYVECLA